MVPSRWVEVKSPECLQPVARARFYAGVKRSSSGYPVMGHALCLCGLLCLFDLGCFAFISPGAYGYPGRLQSNALSVAMLQSLGMSSIYIERREFDLNNRNFSVKKRLYHIFLDRSTVFGAWLGDGVGVVGMKCAPQIAMLNAGAVHTIEESHFVFDVSGNGINGLLAFVEFRSKHVPTVYHLIPGL